MKRIILLTLSILLCITLILPSLASCDKKIEEDPKATFTNQTRMFADDGIAIVIDSAFTKYYPDNIALACENGDLKFEAFALEKYYFTENGRDIKNAEEALAYVNPGKDQGAEVDTNTYWQPYVEFATVDPEGSGNTIIMYYVCIEDTDRYWFCTFFSYEKNYEEYKAIFFDYLDSLAPHEATKQES